MESSVVEALPKKNDIRKRIVYGQDDLGLGQLGVLGSTAEDLPLSAAPFGPPRQ